MNQAIHSSTSCAAPGTPEEKAESEQIARFRRFIRFNKGRGAKTVDMYCRHLARLEQFLGQDGLLAATEEQLEMFTGAWLHKQGVQANSRRPYVAAIKAFYEWAKHHKVIAQDPAEALHYPKAGKRLPSMMTLANAEKLMWAPDFSTLQGVRDAAILALMAGCGLRRDGVAGLNESALMATEYDGQSRYMLRTFEKGEKERLVPVPREADMLLRLYLEHPDLQGIDRNLPDGDRVLFISFMNMMVPDHLYIGERRRLAPKAVWEIVKKHGRKAGIDEKQLHPHALRHLFGTELAEDDIDLLVRQELLGHAKADSTKIYTHLATRKKFAAIDKSSPLAKIKTPVNELLAKLRRS
ncbi:tyrosine-type recombinase/integrase [uncultured Herbaspirillum sp.]|uniref:tyrosine-type recombinase/integrase n=1 Tax=uncultured Herbaspirillum sp. TaxID=160236 RepID=UPI002621B29C|nr:tyrosine-type recombinase/integrase [uncultured Herbaspirillum sp.]